jgi:hypothetical protein
LPRRYDSDFAKRERETDRETHFGISGFDRGWVGFNPQPDPRGFGGSLVGLSLLRDPMVTWTLDIGTLDGNDVAGTAPARA